MRKCLGCGTPEDLFIVEGKLYCLFCLPVEELPLVQRADILLKRVQARRAGDEPRREPRGWQKRLNAALLLTVWAIPLMALARAPRRPSADAPIQVPISTKFLGPDGRTGTLAGTLTLTWDTPTPPPVTDLKVSWLAMAPASVTLGSLAQVTVQMNQAWPTAVVVSLSSADPVAQVPASLTIPAGASKASAPVTTGGVVTAEKLVAITAKYGASTGSANLRVLPSTGPPPPPVPELMPATISEPMQSRASVETPPPLPSETPPPLPPREPPREPPSITLILETGATIVSLRKPNCLSHIIFMPQKIEVNKIVCAITPGTTNCI